MRIGDIVNVCYDGKDNRGNPGIVTKVKNNQIWVKFRTWIDDEEIETNFYRRHGRKLDKWKNKRYGAFVKVNKSVMNSFFGLPGDWYSAFK